MWLGVSASAHAQTDDELAPATHTFISSERVVIELRGGPYTPNMDGNSSFKNLYGTDIGPLLDVEIDAIAYRLPKFLYLTVGGSAGHVGYSAHAFDVTGVSRVSEKSTFSMFPLAALGALRIDALARRLGLPFVLTGKIGWEWAHWSTATGSRSDAAGWSTGLVYGGQFALDLDSFEPSAARRMDEEWGINHSFLFFELLTFTPTKKALPVGGTNWLIGLGFIF
jgi:hypothetical protein